MSSDPVLHAEEVTVLIVDDTPANLAVVVDSLEQLNVEVAVAQDGDEALARAEYLRPALILLDVVMPRIDGFELCRRLKAKDSTRDIPVIFMTSSAGEGDKLKGFEVGAVDYLTKPLHVAEVRARVNAHLALQRMRKELQIQNARLQREIRERVQAEEQLRESNHELEAFTYSASHDLRAPLRAISGYASMLAERPDAIDECARKTVEKIVRAAQQMEGLIRDLLNYARTGQREMLVKPVCLEAFVQEIENTFQARIKEGGVQFEIVQPLAPLVGDPTLIKQILTNLIDNALTYRRPDGHPRVSVASTAVGDRTVLSVSDNGIGIAPEYHDKIFQVFQRLHAESEYAGTGIGLAIVAKAARAMSGTVRVSSRPGEGSTFQVSLPRPSTDS
jgi:two-component system, sensor histidine kinase and response regulator